jgi:hypothetical protein
MVSEIIVAFLGALPLDQPLTSKPITPEWIVIRSASDTSTWDAKTEGNDENSSVLD